MVISIGLRLKKLSYISPMHVKIGYIPLEYLRLAERQPL